MDGFLASTDQFLVFHIHRCTVPHGTVCAAVVFIQIFVHLQEFLSHRLVVHRVLAHLAVKLGREQNLSLYIDDAFISAAPFAVIDAPYFQLGKVTEGFSATTITAIRVYQEVAE